MQRLLALTLVATAGVTQLQAAQWYEEMKIGPVWSNTFEDSFQGKTQIGAIKGLLIGLGDEKSNTLFDTETLRFDTAYEGYVKWGGTPWTGQHGKQVGLQNDTPIFSTAVGPGWADEKGSFNDSRKLKGFGNLSYASYLGYYRHGSTIVIDSKIHGARVLETASAQNGTVTRSLRVASRKSDLSALVADETQAFTVTPDGKSAKSASGLTVSLTGNGKLATAPNVPTRLVLNIPKGASTETLQVALTRGAEAKPAATPDFDKLLKGGPGLWNEKIVTEGKISTEKDSPYVTDIATLPTNNPWKANTRFGGFDFIDEDTAALSSWNGDVWVVKGLKGDWSKLTWQRIASGLYQTLGLKVINGVIYVNGRDQITQLIDLNGDGETDHFKTFNRDVYVTPNFHEFAFDLQTDKAGNLYFAKAAPVRSGGRGFDPILPHNGIVAKISPDGSKFEVVATGLRAPGGLGIGPNGEITTGENEGTWQPACKINFMKASEAPVFFGCEPSRQGIKTDYKQPLAFLPMDVDNSGGSQVWVTPNAKFGLKPGELLHLSYGQSGVFRVLPQAVGKTILAGVSRLPIKLQSSAMRARFAEDGSLYVLGFRGWQTNAATEAAFQRVRYTGAPLPTPDQFALTSSGVRLHFANALDPEVAQDPSSYSAQRWNYVRSEQYGSGEFSVDQPDAQAEKDAVTKESKGHRKRDNVKITAAKLLPDGKTVELQLEGMKPSMQLKVGYDIESKEGAVFKGDVYCSPFVLP